MARREPTPTPFYGRPIPRSPVVVRDLGAGLTTQQVWPRMAQLPAAHVTAVQAALHTGHDALLRRSALRNLAGWNGVHLVQATYAVGTSRAQVASWMPAGVRGTQLGAAQYVRGRQGHLHVYAAVYLPEVVR